jgi:transcriptional regulator ATRX
MSQPCIPSKQSGALVPLSSALVIVPANTVSNWEDEVKKWTGNIDHPLNVRSLRKFDKSFRQDEIEKWKTEGGVMFLTDALFLKFASFIIQKAQPQILVLDEAHTMLKHSKNATAKALCKIITQRRILLTGTPLQNNVTEYFQLINYVRPGVIEDAPTEHDFDRLYR